MLQLRGMGFELVDGKTEDRSSQQRCWFGSSTREIGGAALKIVEWSPRLWKGGSATMIKQRRSDVDETNG